VQKVIDLVQCVLPITEIASGRSIIPAKARTQGGQTLHQRPWPPACAGATEKKKGEPSVCFLALEFDDLAAQAFGDGFGAGRGAKLAEQLLDVEFNRVRRDAEPARHRLVAKPGSEGG
jgi:hypothetical protein